ncbi:MAG: malonic semialdehyde reductase, partial [Streptosporangiaceae bacterium]
MRSSSTARSRPRSEPERVTLDDAARDLLFRAARSVTSFSDEAVTHEDVREIYELAKWGPTSFNQQPLRVVVVESATALDRLVDVVSPDNRPKVAAAPLVLLLGFDVDFHERLPTCYPGLPGLKDDLFADVEVRRESARLNAALQAAYLILAIRSVGLAVCPMTGFDADAATTRFFPGGTRRALMVLIVGVPDPTAAERLPRLDFDD